jgi:hypothetical protein
VLATGWVRGKGGASGRPINSLLGWLFLGNGGAAVHPPCRPLIAPALGGRLTVARSNSLSGFVAFGFIASNIFAEFAPAPQDQKSQGCDSRSGWDTLIGCAGGTLESVSIRFTLFVCYNPNKPHHCAARRADRSFYYPFWKRNRAGATGDLVCRSHADQGVPPTATEAASGGPVAATGLR